MKIYPQFPKIKYYRDYKDGDKVIAMENLIDGETKKIIFPKGTILTLNNNELIVEKYTVASFKETDYGWYLKHFKSLDK